MSDHENDPIEQTVVTSVERLRVDEEKKAYILFLSGPLVGKLHHLEEGTTTLGRSAEATVPINDERISRKHIEIIVNHGTVVLKDLGSTNGTFNNGKKVKECVLGDGDKIQLSSATIFKFAYQDQYENIFHKELYKMAVLDPVTNLYNKRFFLDRLDEEFSHSKRYGKTTSLIMMDIDFFKKINDTHGHLAGDFTLAHVAKMAKEIVRTEDVMARYGGEEFGCILRDTTTQGAYQLAERIRQKIETTPCQFEQIKIPATISLGVAAITKNSFESANQWLEAADKMLYQSKESGRNKTTALK